MQVFLCPQNVYPGSKAEFRPRTHSFSSSSNRPICRRDGPASHEQPASLGCISPDALCSLVMTPVFGTLHFFGPSESHDGHKLHSKNRTWDHMAGFLGEVIMTQIWATDYWEIQPDDSSDFQEMKACANGYDVTVIQLLLQHFYLTFPRLH